MYTPVSLLELALQGSQAWGKVVLLFLNYCKCTWLWMLRVFIGYLVFVMSRVTEKCSLLLGETWSWV